MRSNSVSRCASSVKKSEFNSKKVVPIKSSNFGREILEIQCITMMHVWKWSSSDKRLQKKVLIVEDKIHRELSSHIHPLRVRLALYLTFQSWKKSLSWLQNISLRIAKYICPNLQIYLIHTCQLACIQIWDGFRRPPAAAVASWRRRGRRSPR